MQGASTSGRGSRRSPYTRDRPYSTVRRMDATHTATGLRHTVNEAAEILGISAEAVRARINRGTLPKEKDGDGTVYVRLDGVRTHTDDRTNGRTNGDAAGDPTNGDATDDRAVSDSLAFRLMRDHIAFLQAELERKDHLLARALERIPPP